MFPFNQMPVNSPWTRTQHTGGSHWLRTTDRWHLSRRKSLTRIIQRDLITPCSCCAEMVWLVAVTGSLRRRGWFIQLWRTEESAGGGPVMTAYLEGMKSRGASINILIAFYGTITRQDCYVIQETKATNLRCIWTGLLAFCPSTLSSLTLWHISTQSTPDSPNPSTLGLAFCSLCFLGWVFRCIIPMCCWIRIRVLLLSINIAHKIKNIAALVQCKIV